MKPIIRRRLELKQALNDPVRTIPSRRVLRRSLVIDPSEAGLSDDALRKLHLAERAIAGIWSTGDHFDMLTPARIAKFRHEISDRDARLYARTDDPSRAIQEKLGLAALLSQQLARGSSLQTRLAACRAAMGMEDITFRKRETCVGNPQQVVVLFPRPSEIHEAAERLRLSIERFTAEPRLLSAVALLVRFLNLHPYTDGNGRVARTLFNWCLVQAGMPASSFLPLSSLIHRAYGGFEIRLRFAEVAAQWTPIVEFIADAVIMFSQV